MGVTIVQNYPIPETKTGPQIIDILTKRVCAIGGVQNGVFCVDCETYLSTNLVHGTQQKSIHCLHNSEYPVTVFSILENGNKSVCLTSDLLFDLLMKNLSQFYVSKKTTRIESRGPRFEVADGDFLVKLGTVTMGQKLKGILCEIEYQPCLISSHCWDLMKEFMQNLFGNCIQSLPLYLQGKSNDFYHPRDTIFQYFEQFSVLKKVTSTK